MQSVDLKKRRRAVKIANAVNSIQRGKTYSGSFCQR